MRWSSCTEKPAETLPSYDLTQEDQSATLPRILEEVSGLAYAGNNQLLCVQDERGIIFHFDMTTKQIVKRIHFAKDNDYEGITIAGPEIFVLESDGTIYGVMEYDNPDSLVVEKIPTFLNSSNDAEGLCFDSAHNRLLVACKGQGGVGSRFKDKKAVYGFNLETRALEEDPVLVIDLEDLEEMQPSGDTQEAADDVLTFFGKNNLTFNPSAIAIHPVTQDIYILSSAGKNLLVLSSSGSIRSLTKLKKSQFKQPEGITFDETGTMYISNEGKGGRANIKAFNYTPKQQAE